MRILNVFKINISLEVRWVKGKIEHVQLIEIKKDLPGLTFSFLFADRYVVALR